MRPVRDGDVVQIKETSRELTLVLDATDSPERDLADYLDLNLKDMSATYVRGPKLADVPYPVKMEPHLVVEFYSR